MVIKNAETTRLRLLEVQTFELVANHLTEDEGGEALEEDREMQYVGYVSLRSDCVGRWEDQSMSLADQDSATRVLEEGGRSVYSQLLLNRRSRPEESVRRAMTGWI